MLEATFRMSITKIIETLRAVDPQYSTKASSGKL